MIKITDSHAASYAEYACATFTMKHAKNYLRDNNKVTGLFAEALSARTKEKFMDIMGTIQADSRWP